MVLTLDVDPVSGDLLGPNFLDIAVSRSKNPTGHWNLYLIDATNDGSNGTVDHDCPGPSAGSTGPCLGDYPHIGLDANGFFITTNEYAFLDPNEQFMGVQITAMSKSDLAEGVANVPFEMFENLQVPERSQVGFTLRAANAPGTEWSTSKHGTVFFASGMVGIESGNPSPDYDAITFWALSNTASLDSAGSDLKLQHRVTASSGFSLGTAVEVGSEDLAGIMYGALEPFFKKGKLKGRVEMQEYLAVEGNNVIMPAAGLDADGRGLSRVHPRGSRPLPERGGGEDLPRSTGDQGERRRTGTRAPGRVQRVLDRRPEVEVG